VSVPPLRFTLLQGTDWGMNGYILLARGASYNGAYYAVSEAASTAVSGCIHC